MRGERANVQFNFKELAEKQVQRKLDMRALRVPINWNYTNKLELHSTHHT